MLTCGIMATLMIQTAMMRSEESNAGIRISHQNSRKKKNEWGDSGMHYVITVRSACTRGKW